MPLLFRWLTDIMSLLPLWIRGAEGWRDRGGWRGLEPSLTWMIFLLFLIRWPDGIKRVIRTQAVKRELDYGGRAAVIIKENYSHQSRYESVIKSALKVKMGLDVSDGEDIAFTDLDQNGGDDRDEEAALIKLSRHQCSVLDMWVSFDTQEKIYVFSPLSLNAKLVGSLYECLAPAEGEVRGCISCAYLRVCVWFLLMHGYIQSCHFNVFPLLLKTDCSCFGPVLPSQNIIIGFTCSSHALCSEEPHFVLHPPFPKTSLLLLPISAPWVFIQRHHSLHREDKSIVCLSCAWFHSPPACFTLLLSQTWLR